MGKAISLLENHFSDHLSDGDGVTDLYDRARWIQQTCGSGVALQIVWRLLSAVCPYEDAVGTVRT